jgi:hypothetical protein
MFPAAESDEAYRRRRIRMWEKRLSPRGRAFPGDPRRWERRLSQTAKLTPLGRRVLGMDSWRDDDDLQKNVDSIGI